MSKVACVNTKTKEILFVAPSAFTLAYPIPNTAWVPCPDAVFPSTWTYDGTNFVMTPVAPTPGPTSWPILKSTIRVRLRAIGLEAASDAARAVMDAAHQIAWSEALFIASNDPLVTAFLVSIGATSDQITAVLAYDPAAASVFTKAMTLG